MSRNSTFGLTFRNFFLNVISVIAIFFGKIFDLFVNKTFLIESHNLNTVSIGTYPQLRGHREIRESHHGQAGGNKETKSDHGGEACQREAREGES